MNKISQQEYIKMISIIKRESSRLKLIHDPQYVDSYEELLRILSKKQALSLIIARIYFTQVKALPLQKSIQLKNYLFYNVVSIGLSGKIMEFMLREL